MNVVDTEKKTSKVFPKDVTTVIVQEGEIIDGEFVLVEKPKISLVNPDKK